MSHLPKRNPSPAWNILLNTWQLEWKSGNPYNLLPLCSLDCKTTREWLPRLSQITWRFLKVIGTPSLKEVLITAPTSCHFMENINQPWRAVIQMRIDGIYYYRKPSQLPQDWQAQIIPNGFLGWRRSHFYCHYLDGVHVLLNLSGFIGQIPQNSLNI